MGLTFTEGDSYDTTCKTVDTIDKCVTKIDLEGKLNSPPGGIKFITSLELTDQSQQHIFLAKTSQSTNYDLESGCLTGLAGYKITTDEYPVNLGFIYDPSVRYEQKEMPGTLNTMLENWQYGLIFIGLLILIFIIICLL